MRPDLPHGWRQDGGLPEFDPAILFLTLDHLYGLTEDLWFATSPDGKYTLDVGWFPESDPGGRFACRLIRQEDWRNPVNEFRTLSMKAVLEWVDSATAFVITFTGEER